MGKSVIIIRGGVAGLAAGCYAQMCGFQLEIFEQHFLPGGLCTSWERRGFTFDGCISYLYGSGEGKPFSDRWRELGVTRAIEMISLDEFIRVRAAEGPRLSKSSSGSNTNTGSTSTVTSATLRIGRGRAADGS